MGLVPFSSAIFHVGSIVGIASANGASGDVSVILSCGAGRFGPAAIYPV